MCTEPLNSVALRREFRERPPDTFSVPVFRESRSPFPRSEVPLLAFSNHRRVRLSWLSDFPVSRQLFPVSRRELRGESKPTLVVMYLRANRTATVFLFFFFFVVAESFFPTEA